MRVLVAVHAFLELKRLLEIAVHMALRAVNRRVFPFQGELGLRVIKLLVDGLEIDPLPAACVVAGRAGLRKAAVMRVFVAIGTLAEWDANVSRLAVRTVRVALGTLHLGVQPGQRISRFRVIELTDVDLLPVDEVVTGLTIGTETSFVLIFVAGGTRSRYAQVRAVEILFFNRGAILRQNVGWHVALVASQPRVFAFEDVSGFLVIEGLDVPFDERKIHSVVLGMAAGTFLARSWRNVVSGVQSFMCREAISDLGMALQAFQRGLAAKLVTTGAVGGTT
jgi:hypothetical protein